MASYEQFRTELEAHFDSRKNSIELLAAGGGNTILAMYILCNDANVLREQEAKSTNFSIEECDIRHQQRIDLLHRIHEYIRETEDGFENWKLPSIRD